MKKIFVIIFLAVTCFLFAQEKCGTQVIKEFRMEKYPDYKTAIEKVNSMTVKWVKENPNFQANTIITIPVVVHVVWKTSEQNISDAQINSQIDVLNKDYRRTNIDIINTPNIWESVAADCEIEFCLAKTDPIGQPTSGIERIQTTIDQFAINDNIHTSSEGGADDWPNEDYLNIWVCNLGNQLLGYATPPSSWIGDGDGLVIGYNYFGTIGTAEAPYNKGRTATHEIGHWLNLEHLWGASGSCGDDQISDTPKQETENYSCPGFPHNPNGCSTTNPYGDMFMNYMDYTNDGCMNLFTNGQKARMLSAINLFRPNFLTSSLCNTPTNLSDIKASQKKLIKVVDILGREINQKISGSTFFYIYDNGSVERKMILK